MARPPASPVPPIHAHAMDWAFEEATAAFDRGEVPVGAVAVDVTSGALLARAGNETEALADPTAHAEVQVLRALGRQTGRPRFPDVALYVTLEPCALCAAAISFARLRHIVFACADEKMGGVINGPGFFDGPTCHHRPHITGPTEAADRSADLMRRFFRARRR